MSETTLAFLVTLLFSGIGVVGDYFLKLASAEPDSWRTKWFAIGFVLYSSTAFGWVYVMRHLKLATIGVLYSVSMVVLLTTIGTVLFGERVSTIEVVGIAMGVGSLLILARFA